MPFRKHIIEKILHASYAGLEEYTRIAQICEEDKPRLANRLRNSVRFTDSKTNNDIRNGKAP